MTATLIQDARQTTVLKGHEAAIAHFNAALGDRMHHAWMLHGPDGVGKTTFAFHIANHLLSGGKARLGALHPSHETFRQIAAGSHRNLFTLAQPLDEKTGLRKNDIPIASVRALISFFQLTANQDQWRVAIVEGAQNLNRNSANALLKLLEEPPPRSLIILTVTSPGRLLPTIRSRCRLMRLEPLTELAMQDFLASHHIDLDEEDGALLLRLAEGCPGRALTIMACDGLTLYRQFVGLFAPETTPRDIMAFAEQVAAKDDQDRYDIVLTLIFGWLLRLIRLGATNVSHELFPGEGQLQRHLLAIRSLSDWIDLIDQSRQHLDTATTVNLDRKLVLFNTLRDIIGVS